MTIIANAAMVYDTTMYFGSIRIVEQKLLIEIVNAVSLIVPIIPGATYLEILLSVQRWL